MEDRIDTLEREASAIKVQLAEVRVRCANTEELSGSIARTASIETAISVLTKDLARLQADVAALREAVAHLQADVATMRIDIEWIKGELAQLREASSACATKEDLKRFATREELAEVKTELHRLESRFTRWMLTMGVSIIGLQLAMFGYLIAR